MFLVLVTSTCKDEDIPKPGKPSDLVFEGQWIGNTTQMKLTGFEIENISNRAQIVKLKIGYLIDTLHKLRTFTDLDGLAEIINGNFTFDLPDGGSFSGSFQNNNQCDGVFTIFDETIGQHQPYSFTAISDTNQKNLQAIGRVSFRVDESEYSLLQDFGKYFPETENIPGKKGNIIGATFSHKNNTHKGKKHLWIKAGRIYYLSDIPEMFSPGVKNYSINAGNGFEISFYDHEAHFIEYSTSKYGGDQEGSRFEILEFEEIETGNTEYRLYKFIATFNCSVYRKWGEQKNIDQGFFIGYIDTRSFK